MMIFRFVAYYYLKYVLIVFCGLEMFFISIDSLKYVDKFPDSANLVILFFVYDALYAFNYTLPISFLLGLVIFYISMIKSNQYTALLAIGFSKKNIFKPILIISLFFSLVMIGLNATPFVYAQEKAEAIIYQGKFSNTTEDLLVKYGQDYVYFGKIFPILQKAQNIKVFQLKNHLLVSFTQADTAFFQNGYWVLQNANVSTLPEVFVLGKKGLDIKHLEELKILKGFRPKILDTIYQNKPSVSIIDAVQSLMILKNQHAGSEKIRAMIYSFVLVPFFVPFTAMIIVYYTPSLARYGNLALLSFEFIVISLVVWGLFFALGKLSISGLFLPEIGILLPLIVLVGVAFWHFNRINRRI
ncbi:LptF/LptG family permease [Helicobacter sp. 13S00477-4]|uniref:LptF/LptG family permease n=1 Tax=Helicobacter sp. 13S00477-4 TaxID=1905759 RepID=UPI000BA75C72|nr:LptF/LptG family permease [Helicobacter sp. 13S00477-4]PAF51574.1 permease [Helicobacter sp. 13S00477-4]